MRPELLKESEILTQKAIKEVKPVTKTIPSNYSSFFLIQLKQEKELLNVFTNLKNYSSQFQIYATKGDYQIVLFVDDATSNSFENNIHEFLNSQKNIKSYSSLAAATKFSLLNDNYFGKVKSLLAIVVEEAVLEKVVEELLQNEIVITCYSTNGEFNLIAEVNADSFVKINKLIENRIVNIDGVLKVKELPLINLFE